MKHVRAGAQTYDWHVVAEKDAPKWVALGWASQPARRNQATGESTVEIRWYGTCPSPRPTETP